MKELAGVLAFWLFVFVGLGFSVWGGVVEGLEVYVTMLVFFGGLGLVGWLVGKFDNWSSND